MTETVYTDISRFSELDIYLFKKGSHYRLFDKLGSHPMHREGMPGTYFAVWAPNAEAVSVIGDFNAWDTSSHPLACRPDGSGIWEGFLPRVEAGTVYKYHIISAMSEYRMDKADPFARLWEVPPQTGTRVWSPRYTWQDQAWMDKRSKHNALDAPMSIYEVHLGSWARRPDGEFLSYQEVAESLGRYVREMGFTHVEFLPLMEHPFYGSWGYQCLGFFAPSSRYGTPEDFMALIDHLHSLDIGVILDWVPSHFPNDGNGLAYFDGTHLFEHADPRQGFHPEWKSCIFNYSRNEVRSFLISSALYWLETFHVDGLRVDAVASMLYLDYGREDGEWIPNKYGGRENLPAIDFIRTLNQELYTNFPDIQIIAEESTSWPMVTRPPYAGGLGFGLKWNMGWMHDSLEYMAQDPIYRRYHQNKLTFALWYAFTENFLLPLSHDEVVYGKGSLLGKMPGDQWQQFANLRLLFGYMYTFPGKKLVFMGGEFGQRQEWYHEEPLHWELLEHESHSALRTWMRDLNHLYRREPGLHSAELESAGFEWADFSDWENSVISYLRMDREHNEQLLVVCNFTPVPREDYRLGVTRAGTWDEIANSDALEYGGSGMGNLGLVESEPIAAHGRSHSLSLTLPPLAMVVLKHRTSSGESAHTW
ncbi:1,4-alpha-glucan branching protein GlgB [Desulfovermiculus halophilus]|jgi:1,4-alpha-glucan branching enzyme|uniref:1,4-alpha-glucan branching protein GlgB n=1 Tax=Desulfovermiculus halophilus TaxID=339722 RepID=UPI0005597F89|nr:1,4-alpha-glucan branching protein GlgB [Desulfovermiculus halophilus]